MQDLRGLFTTQNWDVLQTNPANFRITDISGKYRPYCLHEQGLVNVLLEHHQHIGDIISKRYLKVMFKIPKMEHLPIIVEPWKIHLSHPIILVASFMAVLTIHTKLADRTFCNTQPKRVCLMAQLSLYEATHKLMSWIYSSWVDSTVSRVSMILMRVQQNYDILLHYEVPSKTNNGNVLWSSNMAMRNPSKILSSHGENHRWMGNFPLPRWAIFLSMTR